MKTINIKGKEYVEVHERLKYFREDFPTFSLTSEILTMEDGVVVMKATITDSVGKVVATGHAYEKEDSSFINKTSYVENCETSAWGRALANFGIGLDTSVASAEEVINAVNNQRTIAESEVQLTDVISTNDKVCPKCAGNLEPQFYNDNPWYNKAQDKWKHVCSTCKHYEWLEV